MKKLFYPIIKFLLFSATITFSLYSCGGDDPVTPEKNQRGQISQINSLGTITIDEVNNIFTNSNTHLPIPLKYSVEVFSVNYYSVNWGGEAVLVSGAILVPQGISSFPLLSLQHGTQSKRDLVASVSVSNSVEGTIGLMTASLGYLTVIPDYLGFGVSNVMHPYLHAESLFPSIIDLMLATKKYCNENQLVLDGRVFLTGYSEGGYLTFFAQKEIEENYANEFNLTAVAPLSGPYDLKGIMETIFQTETYITPAYIAYFITAYNNIYGWNRLNDFFNAPYAEKMQNLFNGTKTWGEIISQLPNSFAELVNTSFTSQLLSGNELPFINALEENTFLDWRPNTPIHFFHGDADEIVPYKNVLTAIDALTSRGATNIQLTTIPGGTHVTSGPVESIGAIEWFEQF